MEQLPEIQHLAVQGCTLLRMETLGHEPLLADGALMHALEHRGLKRGMAGICIGGGEGTAVALELA